MVSKLVLFATVLAVSNAVPIWYNEVLPSTIVRVGRAPLSYGFGTAHSSNIAGISQSTGFGTALSTDGAQAYGSGFGGSSGGYSQGIGIARAGNAYPVYQAQPTYTYQPTYAYQPSIARPTYNNAIASATNFGGYNAAAANAGGSQALASSSNLRGYDSALSSVNGFGSSVASTADNGFGHQTAVSTAQTRGLGHNTQSVSAAERHGPFKASTAQTIQQYGNSVQNSGATSINGPGIQAAHSHAVQTGFY